VTGFEVQVPAALRTAASTVDPQRRALLRLLAASPLFALASARQVEDGVLFGEADQVLNLFEMRGAAAKRVRPAPWAWMATGADDEHTLRANRLIFDALQLETRRLIDVTRIDTTVELFGQRYSSPIALAPVGLQNLFHPVAEEGTARAAAARGALMIAGHMTSASYTQIARVSATRPWLQLYARWPKSYLADLLSDVARAGCPAVVLTVDTPVGGNRESTERYMQRLVNEGPLRFGNFPAQLDPLAPTNPALTWSFVEWLRETTSMRVLIKGLVDPRDARLALERGVDGIVVSNHGGRQEESNRSSLESLIAVQHAVGTELPLLVDGGFRRGTDVLKALALGARAVCLGRPQIWGLGAFGEEGVGRVLDLLQLELERAMRFCGMRSISAIGRETVRAVPNGRLAGEI